MQKKESSSGNNIDEAYDDDFDEDFDDAGGDSMKFNKQPEKKADPFTRKQKTPSQSDGIEDLSGFDDKYSENEDFF